VVPVIEIEGSSSKTIRLSNTLTLKCNYAGAPPPNITWLINGTEIDQTIPNININTTVGVSGITTLTWGNSPVEARGSYECSASNIYGTHMAIFDDVFISCKI